MRGLCRGSEVMLMLDEAREIARRIDHTLLKAEATGQQVDRVCDEAAEHGFAAVCVHPCYVERARRRLSGSGVATAGVVGFPLGANLARTKAAEAGHVVEAGAEEIDVVAALGALVAGDYETAGAELKEVVAAAEKAGSGVVVKVIVETALLMEGVNAAEGERRIAECCRIVRDAGAGYIKTSTGFHPLGGATAEAVGLLAKHAGGLKVKAAGGIRSLADARAMIEAGADRLGCSSSVRIVAGEVSRGGY